ncbi:MAG TPA: isoprenylcysteine carboxylmethyltransferase family protein [Kofleriaceae bacterium]|jgi:protein-S-isoprenylcysteine O-methyltransferase Ste14|nr:isoprenylcysteine carboxylmethyltransferase family protein [Kofleriaceae bacterium]
MWLKLIGGVISPVVFFGAPLFGGAWTFDWPRAQLLVALAVVMSALAMFGVLAKSPGLLDERYKSPIQNDQPLADMIITPLIGLSFLGFLIFIPRDVFHSDLLGHPPRSLALVGLATWIAAWVVITLALRANAFAAPIVKHQADRGQRVIDRGPYAIVRHPMYSGALLMYVGMPLWLGSYAATIGAIVPMIPIVARLLVEEATLRRELPGYTEYVARVRWRLVPGIW